MKHVLVTGVSTGIGYATVAELLKQGFAVLGSVRKTADAERLAGEFGRDFTPLVFDVTKEEQVRDAAARVAGQLGPEGLFGLVNNAGISRPGRSPKSGPPTCGSTWKSTSWACTT